MIAETTVKPTPVLLSGKAADALPEPDEEDILDWDYALEKPPVRPSGTLQVRLVYAGRSKPEMVPIPPDEDFE